MADAVMDSAIAALQSSLRTAFGETQNADELPKSVGHFGVLAVVEILGQRSGLMLSCEQLRACGKLSWPTPAALSVIDMELALSDVPVPLTAILGRAKVNLEELMQLSPGDILLLDEGVNSPLQVVSPGSSLALSAHLGLSSPSAMRAVRWLPSSFDALSQ